MSRIEREFKNPRAKALHDKSIEILDLVDHLLEAAPDGGEHAELLEDQIGAMHGDSMMIPAKIAGAEGGDYYDIRMENAAIIRKSARDLILGLRGLEMCGYNEPKYFDLLRAEIEEFRKLFLVWVDGFDRKRYYVDEWGIFNPPGVKPGDESPEVDFDDED